LWFDETKEDKVERDSLEEQTNIDIDDITLEEVTKAIKSMKNRKAPGLNGINAELVKYSGFLFHLRLLHFLNMCWKLLQTPKEWSKAKVISIYKKGDRTNTNNYRGISLLDTIYKIYAKILNERLKTIADTLLSEEQMGFRKGRSCTDAIFTLKQVIEKRIEHNCETHIVFVDLEKASDDVNRNMLWDIMEKREYPRHLIIATKSLYDKTSVILDLVYERTSEIKTNKGVRQGCSISPTLFNIYRQHVSNMEI
jgi:hypothetical protein